MTIHIFNPEHDIALASNLANFTSPHAGRQLRHDLGFIPALWADADDAISVDDPVKSQQALERFSRSVKRQLGKSIPVIRRWVTTGKPLAYCQQADKVSPWGWDIALCSRLLKSCIEPGLLPSDSQLHSIRSLSHRRTSAQLLPFLRLDGTIGEAFECSTPEEVDSLRERFGIIVVKAPWSSSGRGIRFVDSPLNDQSSLYGWLSNLLKRQGTVMVEPYYNKVKDFGMEFESDGCGKVSFLGLSLFHTANGAYTGNIIATEAAKREMISRYLPLELLDSVRDKICHVLAQKFKGSYSGPFGVDMMIVRCGQCNMNNELLLHPCVEINLRRTMGHVALTLTPTDDDIRRVMRIEFTNNNYLLKLQKLL